MAVGEGIQGTSPCVQVENGGLGGLRVESFHARQPNTSLQ